jgi:Protein of unknown function (DUF1579)
MPPRTLRTLAFLAAATVLAAAHAPAQDKKDKDPQSAYEPRSGPGAGQKFLEKFVGDWDVAKTFYSRTGQPNKSQGRCRQTMVQGGRFLQSEFTFGEGESQTTGLGLIGFEPATGKFTSVWIDSRQTRMSLRQSPDKFTGEEIALLSKSLDDGGRDRRSRTVSRLEDDGRKIVHRQYTAGPDGQERLVMELVLTRKPDAK